MVDMGNQMHRIILLLAASSLLALTGCAAHHDGVGQSQLHRTLYQAERQASEPGRRVLEIGREMTLEEREIVRGSCWDYANAVYNRAGFPNTRYSRKTVFKGGRKRGPYADASLIQPGDFLYYINHSYHGVTHSAIFVGWLDYDRRRAIMLSYGGERRKEPARYRPYDLSNVYRIIRPNTH